MKTGSIKFKAKRLDNGEWCEGYFYEENGNTYIIENRQKESELNRNLTYQVAPSTVCQFTGLKDSKGKEIWEGDMIKSPYLENVATVEWNDSLCGFKCVDERRYINYSLRAIVESSGWSLIGNKFDKKEVAYGKTNNN